MNLEMENYLRLQCEGHDYFIDYLKGICILFVVLNHCLPADFTDKTLFCIWGSTAVPLFLLLQVFHAFKKGLNGVSFDHKKVWHRVVRPFLLTELIIVSIHFIRQVIYDETSIIQFAKTVLLWGGIGPGCYYPWIYIQFAFLMPFAAKIFRRYEGQHLLILFIVVSSLIDIIGTIFFPMRLYRLLFLRYLFIFYLGYILAIRGFIINCLTTTIAFVSMVATLIFYYKEIDFPPYIHNKISICNWICYLYVAYGFLRILRGGYRLVHLCQPIERVFRWMGIYSYEIFLIQMLFFSLFK